MTYWFIQWTEREVKEFLDQPDFMMDCIGNNASNFKKNATRKDIVWINATFEGDHRLLGTMELGELCNREYTEQFIERSLVTIKYDSYWINTLEWIPIQTVVMDEDFIFSLNFLPVSPLPTDYKSGQHLRTPRILSPLDHQKLNDFWIQSLVSNGILDEEGHFIGDVDFPELEEGEIKDPQNTPLTDDDSDEEWDDDWDDFGSGGGSGGRSPNDDRSDSMNPNSPRYNPGR